MAVTLNASTSTGYIQTADTSGDLALQSNGTTQFTVASTGAYGQLKSGTAVASTSGTSIDFTSIPSWVKRITVMFSGVSTNSTSALLIRIGSGSIDATSTYVGSATALSTNSTTAFTTAFIVGAAPTAAASYSGSAVLSLVGTNIWTLQTVLGRSDGATSVAGGVKSLSGTLDQLRVTSVTPDTFDAGTINILYEG